MRRLFLVLTVSVLCTHSDLSHVRPFMSFVPHLPIMFEENLGQFDPSIQFVARLPGAVVALAPSGATFTARGDKPRRLQFRGGNARATASGIDRLPGTSNYLIGNDPSKWRTNVPTYTRVAYHDVYPGVDVVYYTHNGRLEFDLVIQPGRGPDDVHVELDDGLRQVASATYKRPDGTLIVDPIVTYASYLGTAADEGATTVDIDPYNNVFVSGNVASPTSGSDIFVVKLNPAMTSVLFWTFVGGSGDDFVTSSVVNASGAWVTLAGTTYSPDFYTSPNAIDRTYGGAGDAFILRLNQLGTGINYSTYLGGSGTDTINALTEFPDFDASVGYYRRNDYFVGTTSSPDFPVTSTAFDRTCGTDGTCNGGRSDAFLASLREDGSALRFSTFLGGSGDDSAMALSVFASGDSSANVFNVTGATSSVDFPLMKAVQGSFRGGASDAFVTQFGSGASIITGSTYLGGNGTDIGTGLGPGVLGVVGTTTSTDFPLAAATQSTYGGDNSAAWSEGNAFVAAIDFTRPLLRFSTYFGGRGTSGVAVRRSTLTFALVGTTRTGPLACRADDGAAIPCRDVYLAHVEQGSPVATILFGGSGDEVVGAVSQSGSLIVGSTTSADLPTPGGQQTTPGGQRDAFIAALRGNSQELFVSKRGNGTVTGTPGGINCGSTCLTGFEQTTNVTLTALPDEGWVFAGWSCENPVRVDRLLRICGATFVTKASTTPSGAVDLNGDGGGDVFTFNPKTGRLGLEFADRAGSFGSVRGNWTPDWTVRSADFNGDGLTDLFLYRPDASSVSGWPASSLPAPGQWMKAINNGRGDFDYVGSQWDQGWSITVLDLDGDGRSDLFLYNIVTGAWFKCYTSSALGDFRYVSGRWSPGWSIYPAELNGDRRADLFLYDSKTGQWFWAVNDSDADFSYRTESWAADWSIFPGDFNADGRSDIFLYNAQSGQWFICTNNGTSFTYVTGMWDRGWNVTLLDLDGDRRKDVFLYEPTSGAWVEALNTTGTSFTYASGQWSPAWRVSATDFNADRRADLLLYNRSTGQWFQAINTGLGAFTYGTGTWDTGLVIVASMTGLP